MPVAPPLLGEEFLLDSSGAVLLLGGEELFIFYFVYSFVFACQLRISNPAALRLVGDGHILTIKDNIKKK